MMNNTQNTLISGRLRKRMSLVILPVAIGLLAAPISYSQEDEGPIYELSPFTIEPEEGWVATETLAGTRLRTDFKDVAAQVEVFTMEFMEDYAVNSLEESLIYSLNVANAEDRISGNGDGFGNQAASVAQQIRGVGGGTLSRNFFRAFTNSENYNISRITIASGPQSILFGTGQPAGVLDVTLNRAETSEDFGKISFQVDSFDGHRAVFDYNKVLIEDKLAIRIALLDKNTKQDWKPNYDKDERQYATITWRPFESTTILGHFEHAKRDYSRVNRLLPLDFVTPWFGWGQPAFDNSQVIEDNSWNNLPLIYNRGPQQPTILLNNDGSWEQPTTTYRNMAAIDEVINMPGVSAVNFEADGWTLLDNSIFPTALNNNIAGAVEKHYSEADIYDVFIEQKLAENWYLEIGAHKEDQDFGEWDQGIENRELDVDPNLFLGDGVTPNPHFGEFYLEGRPSWQNSSNSSEYWRVTMSYEFDFEDKFDSILRFFGRHRMALLKAQDREITNLGQQGYRYRLLPEFNTLEEPFFENSNFPPPIGPRVRRWANVGSRGLHARFYLNESNGYIAQESDLIFDGRPITIIDEAGKSWTIDPNNTGYFDAQGKRLVSNNAPQGINTQLDTEQFGYQGFFWNNNIILTYGYRTDSSKSKLFEDVNRDDSRSPVHPNGAHGTGLFPHVDDSVFGPWGDPQSGITRTTGAVVRPLSWLSLFWNESDTFQPNIGRFDPYGTEYPGAQGTGEDIGIRLDLFDNRLSIKYNDFDLASSPSRAANTPFNRWRDPVWNVANRYRTITGLDDYPGAGMGAFRERGRCCYWVMSDNTSTGQEISITARPIDGMNIRFTYTDREAVESNIGLIWFQWIDERLADSWTVFSVPEGGVGDPRDLNGDGGIGGVDEGFAPWTWETAWYRDDNDGEQTLAEYYQNVTVNGPIGATLIQALDGKKNEFDRASSANLNVGYRFSEGVLKGWNVGGAVRWRDAPTVGYQEILVSGVQSPDLENPLTGAIDMTYDLTLGYRGKIELFGDRNYTVRGTIRNLLDEGPTFPVIKSVDGNNIRVGRKTPRQFIVSVEVDL